MRILLLTFYFQPDLCAGSFRATALVEALRRRLGPEDRIDVVTTMPNRYHDFRVSAPPVERLGPVEVVRLPLPPHRSGFLDQARAFSAYFLAARARAAERRYDLVVATSSRLFTAFLGARIARRQRAPLFLDIRDLFVDTMRSLLFPSARVVLLPLFSAVERHTLRTAGGINLVSEGFLDDVRRLAPWARISLHPNGIDDLFLQHHFPPPRRDRAGPRTICYAGNLGQGQGLERIVPGLARRLGRGYRFRIIGSGGMQRALAAATAGLDQVELIPPVGRERLIGFYEEAEILFLHLNDRPAFDKVLPSKIFEYAATGRPILAGVRGTARAFLQREVAGAYCFDPGDIEEAARLVSTIPPGGVDRRPFVDRYARGRIMDRLAQEILALVA
ncbi:MAG: glycosyltransferase WbuB [Zetaproteobacteria bacterium]|nr:MAG: glycosyltransferase WbuB [Zetaproteobacteria bacterium]